MELAVGAWSRRALAAAALAFLAPRPAAAQIVAGDERRNFPATKGESLLLNALLGGMTAATRAYFAGRDPLRAFGLGTLGGITTYTGKSVGAGEGTFNGWGGVALGAAGASVVDNAGSGVGPLEELSFPVASARLRIKPYAERKLAISVNAFESLVVAHYLARPGLSPDWGRSARSGAMVFTSDNTSIVVRGEEANGMAIGPVVIISGRAQDPLRTGRHEMIHVHQHWFANEVWGRRSERYLLNHFPGGRRIPQWLDVGLLVPGLRLAEFGIWGLNRGPIARVLEAEARMLERP
jgi:hypothetical protein